MLGLHVFRLRIFIFHTPTRLHCVRRFSLNELRNALPRVGMLPCSAATSERN